MGRRYVRHRLYMVRPVQAGSVKPRRPVSTPGRTPISENLPASRKDKEYGILIDLTRELTEMLRKNRTIDWQKKETARASMRKMVKHLLKKYKYPPEDYDTAISTVISQCEMWTDNMTI